MMEEIWKDIEGYEGMYQVSNLGRVRSLDRIIILSDGRPQFQRGRTMNQFDGKDGYKIVKLRKPGESRVAFRVHRLVAAAFIPNPDNLPYINHKDEDKINNHVDNLEWCDASYNVKYGGNLQRLSATHKNHPRLSHPIEQYTLDGQFIKSYPSAAEAMRQTGILAVNIRACCRGLYSQSGGYVWKQKQK